MLSETALWSSFPLELGWSAPGLGRVNFTSRLHELCLLDCCKMAHFPRQETDSQREWITFCKIIATLSDGAGIQTQVCALQCPRLHDSPDTTVFYHSQVPTWSWGTLVPCELTQETNSQWRKFFLKRNIGCTVHIKELNEISATHSNSLTPFHPFRAGMSANHDRSLQTLLPIP